MNDYPTFGEYLATARILRSIPAVEMANLLGISKGYYSDIEKGRRSPPEREALDKIIKKLHLSDDEKDIFFDLAGMNNTRYEVSPDLTDYIMGKGIVREALRTAREKADDDDWEQFIDKLKNK